MRRASPLALLLFALLLLASAGGTAEAQPTAISGVVTDGVAAVAGAFVCGMDRDASGRIAMATADCAVTDASGAFQVDTTLVADVGQVVAGAVGYRTVDVTVSSAAAVGVTIAVEPLSAPDNPNYTWWRPTGTAEDLGCGTCHTTIVDQWSTGRHAIAATDPLVLQLYDGTNAAGDPDVAPGYRLEHDDAGECGACHAATASWSEGQSVDLNEIPVEHSYGVYCESCHKVRSVTPGAGPGTLGSLEYWRPSYGDGLGGYAPFAFGPYPNVLAQSMLTSYAPLFRKADLCAGCHQYTNRQGVAVMDTFTDWQAVGNPETTVPCEGCHMKDIFGLRPGESMEWVVDDPVVREAGAQRRNPADVARHEVWGGIEYAPHALDLLMQADREDDEIVVNTTVMNIGANHRVPTGMPFREMLLVVSAVDDAGAPLERVDGPQVGARGGDLAAAAGRLYAKSLADAAGNLTFAFWDATDLLEDTRLATGAMDEAEFRFAAPAEGSAHVSAQLLYRRFSQLLADAKGWDMGEQELALEEETLDPEPPAPDGGTPDGGDAGPPDADAGPTSDFQEGCVCGSAPGLPGNGEGLVLAALPILTLLCLRGLLSGRRTSRG